MELNLVHPFFHFAVAVRQEQKFRAIFAAQSENVFSFGIIVGFFALSFVNVDGRRRSFAIVKVFLVFEET